MTNLVAEAITGRENTNDPKHPITALSEFYRALNGRDITLMEQNWDARDDIAMDNPLGGIKRGWTEIRAVYERLFASAGTYRFEFFDYTLHQFGEVFIAIGRERGNLQTPGHVLELAIRTTRVFRWTGTRWRQMHHHGSIDHPEMLARYQEAVLKRAA